MYSPPAEGFLKFKTPRENHGCRGILMCLNNFYVVCILGFHVTSQYFPNLDVRHICAPRSVK